MIYKPSNILEFGKNKGYTLEQIWKYEPTYISWLIVNHETFCIEVDNFKNLPTPTPFSVGAVSGSEEYLKLINSKLKPLELISKIDINNNHLCVEDILKVEEMGYELKKIHYWFSEDILKKNELKIKQINFGRK